MLSDGFILPVINCVVKWNKSRQGNRLKICYWLQCANNFLKEIISWNFNSLNYVGHVIKSFSNKDLGKMSKKII